MSVHPDDIINELVKDEKDEYEVTLSKHTDIEFFYEIDVNARTLTGWQAHYEYDNEDKSFLKKGKKYSLEDIKKLYYGHNQTKDIETGAVQIVQNSYPFSK